LNADPTPARRTAPVHRGTLESAKKSKPFRIIDFVWRRGPLILGLGIPAFLLLSLLVIPFIHPIYKVDATLLIKQSKEPTLTGRERESIQGDIGVFQRTLVLRLMDREVLQNALDKIPDEKRPDFLKGLGSSDRAIYSLMSRLVAKEVERTYLIHVSLDANAPRGLAITLYEVLSSLIDKLQTEQEKQFASRLNYLRSERDKISARGAEEKKHILDLAGRFTNRSFLRADFSTDLGKMNLIQKLYWDAQADTLAKAAALEEAEKNRATLAKASLEPFAEERVADNFGINQITQWTYGKSQELRATIDGLKPENPDRKYIEDRMASMNDYMANYKKRVAEETIKNLTEKRTFELDNAVVKARNAYESVRQTSEQLGRELSSANEEATQISEGIFEANEFTFGLAQLRDRLAAINTRIDDVELEAKSPLPVTIDQLPVPPEKAASSNASKLRIAVLVLSFGLVGGICLLFDFLDGRIRCREELGAAIGGEGAEPVPTTGSGAEDPAFANIVLNHPCHPAALALRDLALRLILEHQRCGAKLFAFVGSHPRAGNTAISLNVARAISAHGFKVLLAEFPTQAPGLAAAAGLIANAAPPSPWGNKETDPESAVEMIPWVAGVPEDRIRSSFDSFLASASKAYDVVVLDLVSLSRSDIANEAAMKSDVVVVTARQHVALFSEVRSIVESAAAGGVPAITTLLNFCQPDPLRLRTLALLSTAQSSTSALHEQFNARAREIGATLLKKLIRRIKKQAPAPTADLPETPDKKP
jgi:polysaccharide biosynthesis transport protein